MKLDDNVSRILAKNRAEELGSDVWQHFVIPPFYERLDLQTARKPRLIIGGRGCGKTMLLRYLSHQSMFSPDRQFIPDSAASHIGLFWRTDTNFASLMSARDISSDIWHAAFAHLAALLIGREVLQSLKSIAESKSSILEVADIETLDFSRLSAFDSDLPGTTDELYRDLESRVWTFEGWVSNVRKIAEPIFLPGKEFIAALIEEIRSQIVSLKDSVFYVYVDEYENLQHYQQKIINAWLKHSEAPLIFNLAMKKNAFETLETTGPESLSDIHDFRQHNLEEYILEEHKGTFFAEILLLKLSLEGVNVPVDVKTLRDPSYLEKRSETEYVDRVLVTVEKILPDVSHENLAREVFSENVLLRKLHANVEKALATRKSRISPERFIRKGAPEASIVTPALIFRPRNKPEDIDNELDKLEKGEKNRFTGSTNWIHNNFIASLLQLYEPFNRACPFYAGFQTFRSLSKGNIRHFLELCHKSFERSSFETNSGEEIAPSLQADAARQTSAAFLGEIRSFGGRGNQLHTFVLSLGSVFSLAHQRPTLSENEQSHFSITRGLQELTADDVSFLREAVKWSVLFEEKETKTKGTYAPITTDYVLNPIYAPYFHISYRKKRKLSLNSDQLICLIRGTFDEVEALIKKLSKDWAIKPTEDTPSLFSYLTGEY